MRFYAACLASYNNGSLHGQWIDASSDVDEMQEEIATMLRASRFPNVTVAHPETGEQVLSAEEWAVHDYDGLPSSLGEYPGLEAIAEFVELAEEHSLDADDLGAIVSHFGSLNYAKDELANRFAGRYESLRAYADEQAEQMLECHGIKDDHPLAQYFDYEQYAHEMRHSVSEVDLSEGVAIFFA